MSQKCIASRNMVSFTKSLQDLLLWLPSWKQANANKIFVATDVAREDNEVHDIPVKRSTLFGLTVCCVFLSCDELIYYFTIGHISLHCLYKLVSLLNIV